MNNDQRALLGTGQSVSRCVETFNPSDLPPAFIAARVGLKQDLTLIATLGNAQAQPLAGLTRHRDQVFEDGIEVTLIVAALVQGYAKRRGLTELAAKVELSLNDLRRGRFSRRAQLMQQVHEAVAGVDPTDLAELGVTAARLAELKTKAEAADALKDLPRDAIAARRVVTKQLGAAFDSLRSRLRDELDPQMEARRALDPVGYERYQAARIVIMRSGPSAESADEADAAAAKTDASGSALASGTPGAPKLAA